MYLGQIKHMHNFNIKDSETSTPGTINKAGEEGMSLEKP